MLNCCQYANFSRFKVVNYPADRHFFPAQEQPRTDSTSGLAKLTATQNSFTYKGFVGSVLGNGPLDWSPKPCYPVTVGKLLLCAASRRLKCQ